MESVTSPPTSTFGSSFFSPLLISMLGIVATTIAILFYHFFLVRYCIRRHHESAAATAPGNSIAAAPPPFTGVEKKVLDSIPIFVFSALKTRFQLDKEECIFCLGELEDEDKVRFLPNCKHAFHVMCIDQWFEVHASCPLCRSPVIAPQLDDEIALSDAIYGSEEENSSSSSSSDQVPCFGILRHCKSMGLPRGERTASYNLKRSISLDQSFVIIDLQMAEERNRCSSSSPCRTASYLNHFDRVSSKLFRSFSRLRLGKGSAPILPY